MLIAEQLLLIAIDPETGRIPLGTKENLKIGLSGALLAELALDDHITLDDRQVYVATDPVDAPTDPMLAQALALLEGDKPLKPKAAVKRVDRLTGGVWDQLVDRLVDAGVLGRERGSALTPTRHPVLDIATHATILATARRVAATDEAIEPHQAVVLAFAGPCRLLERIAPERKDHRHAKTRISRATELAPFGPAVKAIIDDLNASVVVV